MRDCQVKPVPDETRPIDQVSEALVETRDRRIGRIAASCGAAHGGVG